MAARAPKTRASKVRDSVAEDAASGKVRLILGAARKVFLKSGYGAASMDAIARAAGVSKATLYTHFDGKDELFEALMVAECRHFSDQIGQRACEAPNIRAGLLSLAEDFNNLMCTKESLAMYRIVVAETVRFPELGRIFYDSGPKVMISRIAELLARASACGALAITDAHVAAVQFIGLVRGDSHLMSILGLTPAGKKVPADYIESGVDLFLAGYGTGK
jgi:TetR/AcrR family transcriptional regulator, mexJK operon transcriptional repressor